MAGNDPDAKREFQDNYGSAGNAQQIIDANQRRFNRESREAGMQDINTEKTEALSPAQVASAADVDEDVIRDYAIRGKFLSVVVEDENGGLRKLTVDAPRGKAAPAVNRTSGGQSEGSGGTGGTGGGGAGSGPGQKPSGGTGANPSQKPKP